MAASINLRIFRRNTKNTIILYNGSMLPDNCKESICAFLVDSEGNDGPLIFSKFTPDSPEKFAKDVDGIVINHVQNKIDPTKPCTIKLVFGEGDDGLEVVKPVLPANSAPEIPDKNAQILHMYGFDYNNKTWIPMPVDRKLCGGE